MKHLCSPVSPAQLGQDLLAGQPRGLDSLTRVSEASPPLCGGPTPSEASPLPLSNLRPSAVAPPPPQWLRLQPFCCTSSIMDLDHVDEQFYRLLLASWISASIQTPARWPTLYKLVI